MLSLSRKCDKKTHQFPREKILVRLKNTGGVDEILSSLYDAMAAEDEYDVEGDLLDTIRKELGKIYQ
ncbi:TPA: hypothetical protein EYP70_07245 [Candidatus Bathyarchaeota archaeon]|nr:hypothetical protein [Candidatus Bathyarchaeota archaeon]